MARRRLGALFFGLLSGNLSVHSLTWPIARRYWKAVLGGLGQGSMIMRGTEIVAPKHVRIGSRVYVGRNCAFYGWGGLEIGDGALIAREVLILTRNHLYRDSSKPIREQGHSYAPVAVGSGAWIGARVVLLPGVQVGPGAVIAAGAVVTKSVEEDCVVAGIPARAIGRRE